NGRQFLSSDKDRNPAWAPDGKHVAFLSTRDAATEKESESSNDIGAQIWVIPTDGGEATKLTTHRGNIKSFDWMKDSSAIVVAAVDSATGGLTTLTHNNTPEANVQWSPEGKMLSYLAPSDTTWDLAEDKLWLIPSEGGQPRKLTATFNGDIGQYSWSSDGQSI